MKKEYDLSQAKRGSVCRQKNKTRITIYLDNEIVDRYRAKANVERKGYQTLINEDLSRLLKHRKTNETESIRSIIREELKNYAPRPRNI